MLFTSYVFYQGLCKQLKLKHTDYEKMILPILCAFLVSACTNNIDSDNQNPTNAKTVTALGETQVSNGDYQTDPAQEI